MMQQTRFYLMINFKLIIFLLFSYVFMCTKNSQINHFNSNFKSGKFWGVTKNVRSSSCQGLQCMTRRLAIDLGVHYSVMSVNMNESVEHMLGR